LEERLVYGGYPQLRHLKSLDEKKAYLNNMLNSYLLKDILVYENVKNASKIYNLLKLIAFQIGGEVSLQELGNKLSICKNTVDKYLDLLCKMFILHRVDGFSRNLQKESTKSSK
jgi:predicted AAA+ superfamily ATPase